MTKRNQLITIIYKKKIMLADSDYIEGELIRIDFDNDNYYITYRKPPLYLEYTIRIPKDDYYITFGDRNNEK